MLFAIGFVFTFINGGLTGLFLGNVTVDVPLSDTMFVVAHFHMVMGVSPVLVVCGAIYHWYPKMTGRMLNDTLGKLHFWITLIGTYSIFLPMHYLGILGVPRRYFTLGDTYFIPQSVHEMNVSITIAALIVATAQLIFIFNLIWSLKHGKPAGGNPWRATTLEWQTPETPPRHGNWGPELPVVYRWAYEYGAPGNKEDFVPQNQPPTRTRPSRWVTGATCESSRRHSRAARRHPGLVAGGPPADDQIVGGPGHLRRPRFGADARPCAGTNRAVGVPRGRHVVVRTVHRGVFHAHVPAPRAGVRCVTGVRSPNRRSCG